MQERTRVVILGGGFGGLVVARRLARRVRASACLDITVIDARAAHVYTPWLYELATSCLTRASGATAWSSAKHGLDIAFATLRGYDGVRFRRGYITGVDKGSRHVLLRDGVTVPYDVLVIALGGETNFYGIEGLRELSVPLKSLDDTYRIRESIMRNLKGRKHGSPPVHVVVGGAGPSGTEFATELMATVHASADRGYLDRDAVQVTVLDAAPDVLMMSSEAVRERARRRLERLGVNVRLGASLSAITQHSVEVSTKGSVEHLPCDLCVWSGGIMMGEVVRGLPFAKDPKGRLLVDAWLRAEGEERVFALGDCALSMNPFTHMSDPQTAEVAVDQARYVAKNIMRAVEGRALVPFHYPEHWSMLITLGGKYALGTIRGFSMKGYPAYLVRRLVDLHYFLKILSPIDAWRFWWRGVDVYAKNEEGD